jgi:hypothetical protein
MRIFAGFIIALVFAGYFFYRWYAAKNLRQAARETAPALLFVGAWAILYVIFYNA